MPDSKSIPSLFDEYGEAILTFIFLMVQDYPLAEDLTQEVFIKAFEKYNSFHHQSTEKTWLFSIAHHHVIDHLRKKHPLKHFFKLSMNEMDTKPQPEQFVAMSTQSEELYSALQNLSWHYRQVIILRKLKEFSTKETADILNWSESKVKMTLKRALVALKNELLKEGFIYEEFI